MRYSLAALALLVAAGCSRGPNIVGTWHSGLGGAFTTYHFRPDGAFSLDSMFEGYQSHVDGKYHFDGGMLYLDPTNADVKGFGPRIDEMKSTLAQSSRLYYQIYSPDQFRLGKQDPPLVLSRMSRNP